MVKFIFVGPKFRLRHIQKNEKKRTKNEKSRFAKKQFFILACSRVGHYSGDQYELNILYGVGVFAKKNL